MKKISLIFFSLMFFIGTGCGSSSSTSDTQVDDVVITNPEYALITYNDVIVMDTEKSELRCDLAGENCYSFATRYDEERRLSSVTISLAIIEPSGHRFIMYFDGDLITGREYEFNSNAGLMAQDIRFYATYDTPELQCGDTCYNAYNYSDTVVCNSNVESCRYYKIDVRENSEDTLDFDFEIWNKYFLEYSPSYSEASRSGLFTGRIIIDKKAHLTNEDLLYPR